FVLCTLRAPTFTVFPYTTLFRSIVDETEGEALLVCQVVVDANQFLPPVGGLNRRGDEHRISSAAFRWKGYLAQKALDCRIIRIKACRRQVGTCTGAATARVDRGALIAEVACSLLNRGHRLIEVLSGHPVSAPLLRPEEECVILPDRPADGVPIVVLFVGRNRLLEVIARVEGIAAHELVARAGEACSTRIGLHFVLVYHVPHVRVA